MKYLVLLLVLAVAFWLWRGGARRGQVAGAEARARLAKPQDMVPCAHCGVHVPASQAIAHGGHTYCGPEHQRLGPR
ncbi:PP0621 family protein [Paracidovorax avenae]